MFVLAPIHNPRHLDTLLKSFREQELLTKRLIIVSDGFKRPLVVPPGITYSHQATKRGVGAARNECVRIARELNPNELAAFVDCDDKYRRPYLGKVLKALKEYPGCGQGEFWQRNLLDNKQEVLIGEGTANQVSERGMAGGTLAFHLKYCVPFSETLQTGEDTAWCRDMRESLLDSGLRKQLEEQGLKPALWSMSNFYYTKVNRGPNAGHTHPTVLDR